MIINSGALCSLMSATMDGHIKYQMGAKAKYTTDPAEVKAVDCSGYVGYMLFNATGGGITLPMAGTWHHMEYFKSHFGNTSKKYVAVGGNEDNILRVAIFLKSRQHHTGHEWLILNGETIESHSGVGPDRRDWNDPKLLGPEACFELGPCLGAINATTATSTTSSTN